MAERNIYFIGIEVPGDLCYEIEKLQGEFHRERGTLQPLVPHITLLHPNCLKGIMPHELIPKVKEVAERYLPLNVELSSVQFFGSHVAFIEVNSLRLHSLHRQLANLLPEDIRQSQFRYPFRPHITIAQIHRPRELSTDHIKQTTEKALRLPVRVEIDSLSHFQWIRPRDYKTKLI